MVFWNQQPQYLNEFITFINSFSQKEIDNIKCFFNNIKKTFTTQNSMFSIRTYRKLNSNSVFEKLISPLLNERNKFLELQEKLNLASKMKCGKISKAKSMLFSTAKMDNLTELKNTLTSIYNSNPTSRETLENYFTSITGNGIYRQISAEERAASIEHKKNTNILDNGKECETTIPQYGKKCKDYKYNEDGQCFICNETNSATLGEYCRYKKGWKYGDSRKKYSEGSCPLEGAETNSFIPPPPPPPPTREQGIPPEWKAYKDKNGRTFYFNTKTSQTQWEKPVPIAVPVHGDSTTMQNLSTFATLSGWGKKKSSKKNKNKKTNRNKKNNISKKKRIKKKSVRRKIKKRKI